MKPMIIPVSKCLGRVSTQLLAVLVLLLCLCLHIRGDAAIYPQSRIVRVADDQGYPPYIYVNDAGMPEGFEADLFRLIEQDTGLKFEWTLTEFGIAVDMLRGGQAELIPGMFVTEKRRLEFGFTRPYLQDQGVLFVATDSYHISRLEDLRGRRVGVQQGEVAEQYLIGSNVNVNLYQFHSQRELLQAVADRKIDAAISNYCSGLYFLYQLQLDDKVKTIGEALFNHPFAVAADKNNNDNMALLAVIDASLAKLQDSGQIEALKEKWFGKQHLIWGMSQQAIVKYGFVLAGFVALVMIAFSFGMLYMARRKQAAETVLQCTLDGLEVQVEERTKELSNANQELTAMNEEFMAMNEEINSTNDKLRESNNDLEKAYIELKSAQSQVIHQEKMASIGQLAAGVAHEINNPLGFVTSNFETLQKYMGRLVEIIAAFRSFRADALEGDAALLHQKAQELSEMEKQKKLDYILQDMDAVFPETMEGLKRVGDIVKALRIFSRMDQQGNAEEYDLNEGIQNSLIVSRNEIKYIAEIREELSEIPVINAVGGQINQVLLNILLNAAYTIKEKGQEGLGLITVRTCADNRSVYCSISDNGKGMPEHIQKDIFNPFFTTKPIGQGTGLGLSISYDIIVNKHNGDISVSSVEGEGTTFTIRLPLAKPSIQEVAPDEDFDCRR